ncbi:MAG TPA: hypothetical protein VF209_01775 [Patescibacteria group bacterium]
MANNNQNQGMDEMDQTTGMDEGMGQSDTGQKGGQSQRSDDSMNYEDWGSEGMGGLGEKDDIETDGSLSDF